LLRIGTKGLLRDIERTNLVYPLYRFALLKSTSAKKKSCESPKLRSIIVFAKCKVNLDIQCVPFLHGAFAQILTENQVRSPASFD